MILYISKNCTTKTESWIESGGGKRVYKIVIGSAHQLNIKPTLHSTTVRWKEDEVF